MRISRPLLAGVCLLVPLCVLAPAPWPMPSVHALAPPSALREADQARPTKPEDDPDWPEKRAFLRDVLRAALKVLGRSKELNPHEMLSAARRAYRKGMEYEDIEVELILQSVPVGEARAYFFMAYLYGTPHRLWMFRSQDMTDEFFDHIGMPRVERGINDPDHWLEPLSSADQERILGDITVGSLVPTHYREQLDFLRAIPGYFGGDPPIAIYKLFFARSGFATLGVGVHLNSLQAIEESEVSPNSAMGKQLKEARAALAGLAEGLPIIMQRRNSWEALRMEDFVPVDGDDAQERVAQALETLGWGLGSVEDRVYLLRKAASEPVPLKPTSRFVEPPPKGKIRAAMQSAARRLRKWATPKRKSGKLSDARHDARLRRLGQEIRQAVMDRRFSDAVDLVTWGIAEPGRLKESYEVLRDHVGKPFATVLLSRMDDKAVSAFLLAGIVMGDSKATRWGRRRPDEEGLAWAVEVLGLVDAFTGKGPDMQWSVAPLILREMAKAPALPSGPAALDAIVDKFKRVAGTDLAYDLARRTLLYLADHLIADRDARTALLDLPFDQQWKQLTARAREARKAAPREKDPQKGARAKLYKTIDPNRPRPKSEAWDAISSTQIAL